MNPKDWSYSDVHGQIAIWIRAGKLWPNDIDNISNRYITPVDRKILHVFGIRNIKEADCMYLPAFGYEDIIEFNVRLKSGKLDVAWLFSPHGLTLFKALISRYCHELR